MAGSDAIVGIVDKYAIEPAICQVGYLTHCKSNLENLQTQVNNLNDASEQLRLEVVEAIRLGFEETKLMKMRVLCSY
ncbi:hypothetical protein TB2_003444 [Malus domestica]